MPGPGGYGGPHGGHHGGPHGGFGGPGRFNRPFPHFDYNIPSMSNSVGVPAGSSIVEAFTFGQINITETMHRARLKKGKVGGIFTGIRTISSGGIRKQVFEGRLSTIDMQLAENRITKQQANKRKMDAAKKYNRYLLKIGYLTREEYTFVMTEFANKIGVRYVDDTQRRGHNR